MHPATKAVRATLTPPRDGEPLHAGPVFASPYHAVGDPAAIPYTYGRAHNPTWTELERAIAVLESDTLSAVGVRAFASGLAAVAAVFGTVLRPGDTVVLPGNAYYTARQLLQEQFAPIGVTLRLVAHDDVLRPETLAGARLLWLETPSNPRLEITDLRAAVAAAHAAGALVAVDNTSATPLAQKPLDLGADYSVSSDSKMISGQSDILLGHAAVRDAQLLAALDRYRNLTGAIAGPMEAWLLLRSLPTLPLRLERASANALAIAQFLSVRAEVSGVLYPGLPQHRGHAIAAAQMTHFGSVLGFTLASQAIANDFLQAAHLVTEATSFGAIVTTAERRARWGSDDVPAGFIRLSAGCEHIDDLLADLAQALDTAHA